ncbi:MAG TPA: single-stranded DNA-binding protein [Alphaproteobacteria bacterium]|nr:single-stranded DNA-binding protein [Alphaproteobacteria bacterium]
MAGSVNKVILVGNLGKDPEVRSFQNGGRVARLSIATSESWKDKNSGERKEKTEWHRVDILNDKLVEIAERYLKKGSKVYLEGQLETQKYTDKDGQEKYSTVVTLRPFRGELTMLDTKGGGSGGFNDNAPDEIGSMGGGSSRGGQRAAIGGGGASELDDEIPF